MSGLSPCFYILQESIPMKLRTLRVDRAAQEWNMMRKIPARAEDPVGRILFHYVYEK